MKILLCSGIFPPDIGGPASFIPRLAERLVSKGYEIEVVCTSLEQGFDDSRFAYKVHRIDRKIFLPMRMLFTIWTIYRIAKQSDIIFANTLAIEAFLGGLFAKKPVYHKVVGDYAWERARNHGWYSGTIDEYQKERKSGKLKMLDFLKVLPLKYASKIIVPSQYLKKIVNGWSIDKDKIEVIYNAVEMPSFSRKKNLLREINKDLKLVVTVCRLVPWKGVEEIIKSLTHIPDIALLIVGDGPLNNKLKKLSDNLEVSSRVFFKGSIPREQVFNLLSISDVFILNSTYEGLPHVVLEAMKCKVIVIARNAGGTGEVVKHLDTGLLIGENGFPALIEALNFSLNVENKKKIDTIIESASNFINSNFNEDRMIQQTISSIQSNINFLGKD